MGRRGPAPAPTALKLVKGTRKDRVNTAEPKPAEVAGKVIPPEWLTADALELWTQYAPDLERQGVLRAWDVEHFAAWCDSAAQRRRATAALAESSEVVEEPVISKGELVGHRLVRNPWTLVQKSATDAMQRYGARFGLTPSDRSQLKVGDGTTNPTDDLLTG
jgi:P27 family predicted phage terminase small subunit